MPGRSFTAGTGYRYGFNGQEKVNEINGEGNHNTALFWEYDTRFGRRWNLDPKLQVDISDYAAMGGNPILFSDFLGDTWKDKKGNEIKGDKLDKVKVYIFFDPKKEGFKEQTMKQFDLFEKEYGEGSVALSGSTDVNTFKEDWGEMKGAPALVAINMHGSNQALHIDHERGEYLSSNETGKTNSSKTPAFEIKDLPTLKADISHTVLALNSCQSNDHIALKHGSTGSYLTVAESFRQYFNFNTVRTSGNRGVSYNPDGTPRPSFGSWNYLYRGNVPNITKQLLHIEFEKRKRY